MSKTFKEDISGQVINGWKILNFIIREKTSESFWLCECTKCGKQISKSKKTISKDQCSSCNRCANNRYKDITGLRSGRLVAIKQKME